MRWRAGLGRPRRWVIAAMIVAVVLVGLRAALPSAVRSYVNSELAEIGEYSGHVADVDLALIRGAYTIEDLVVVKRNAEAETPFADIPLMDISLAWGALFRGALVGEIEAENPVLNLVQGETSEETQLGAGVNWPAQIRELFPFTFDRVEATGGTVTFRAPGIETDESLTLRGAHLLLENLTNVRDADQEAFADIELTGSVMGNAPLALRGRSNPNADVPTFDVDFELEGARLVDVTPWLERFLSVDPESGTFSMYAELAAAEGRFEGYVKPIMEDAEVFRPGEEASGPFRKAWEGLVDFALNVLENRRTDEVATEIPLSGELENPEAGTLAAIVNLVRNAFVAAFSHGIENVVSLRDVELGASDDDAEEDD